MKRAGDFLEKAASFPNLLLAFKKAWKGCRKTPEVHRFHFHLEPELLRLRDELSAGRYVPGGYQYFKIYEPKERIIAKAPFRDRVVHHAVVNVLGPFYERRFIHDSYATRPKKGTHLAVLRAQQFIRRWDWHLKADVRKFFDNVDHDILLQILASKIKDKPFLALLETIIRASRTPGKGLPIGNLTSQFLANVYLDPLDHKIKEAWRVKGYVRYMDDFILFLDSKKELCSFKDKIETYLNDRLALALKPKSVWLNRAEHGASFLGMRIFGNMIRVRSANRRRSLRRLRVVADAYKKGNATEERLVSCANSIAGHLRYFSPEVPVGPDLR